MSLADQVVLLREKAGLRQSELARMAGISKGFLSRVEGTQSAISIQKAFRIAVALGCSLEDLLGVEAEEIRADVDSRRESAVWRRQTKESQVARLLRENAELKARLEAKGKWTEQ